MALVLEVLEEAVREAVAAAEWYAARSPSASAGFETELGVAFDAIQRLPLAWPRFHLNTHHYLLRRYPFHVVYRVETARVLVVAIAHARRRPGYWKTRT